MECPAKKQNQGPMNRDHYLQLHWMFGPRFFSHLAQHRWIEKQNKKSLLLSRKKVLVVA
jgi:hypothetical protein